jgi:transglutaminase-like putative cysteine protease
VETAGEGLDVIGRARLWADRCLRRQIFSLLTLVLIAVILVYGMADAIQGIERGLLWPLVWFGLLLGWGLACSPMPGWLAAFVFLVLGLILSFISVGQLGGTLAALLAESAGWAREAIGRSLPPDPVPVQSAWTSLASGFGTLVARLNTWLLGLVQGRVSFDPAPTAILWSMALWAVVVWATWAVRRRALPLLGIAPVAALLASTLAAVGGRAIYLLPMLPAALVLQAQMGYDRQRDDWQQIGVRFSPRLRSGTMWLALGLSLALMAAAALVPSISLYRLADLLQGLSDRQADGQGISRSLGLEPQSDSAQAQLTILDARRAAGLPTRHLVGSGPELSERVVMLVSIESAHALRGGEDQPLPTFYWRGLTFDRYTDRGWSAEYRGKVSYAPGELAIPASTAGQRLLRQQVHLLEETGLLFVAGSLVTADREFRIAWRTLPQQEQPGDAFGAITDATDYRADSLLPESGEADLRAAGQDYPPRIVGRYLAVPESVPDRVLALARGLTATEPTPYDRANAIERFLRRFPYTLDLPSPPADRDIADYFLFDLQRGYCDYYATAMVVLARAAGLPARLVTGYASGSYDEADRQYVVTEADAHSWVQVYFPHYGWIDFEPTAGRPAIARRADALPEASAELQTPPEPITAHRARLNWAIGLGIGGGLLAVALGCPTLWLIVDAWRLRRMPPGDAVIGLYRRLYRYARWLGVGSTEGDTPHEFATILALRLKGLAQGQRGGRGLLSSVDEIHWLAELCVRTLYSLHKPQVCEQAEAIAMWGRLRWRLWLARLFVWTP